MKIPPQKDIYVAIAFLLTTLALVGAGYWAWRQFITTPPYVDSERYPIRGIDVSSHNGLMNLDAAAKDGIEFIFIKASEGADFKDSNFKINYWKAQHAGMKVGAYHYFRFGTDGVKQAINFLGAIGEHRLDLNLVIDVEDQGNVKGVSMDKIQENLAAMVDYLCLRGHRVIFYTNKAGYEKYLMQNFPGFPLWICSFSENPIDADWSFWQFDHHAKIDGIRGDVDLNTFNGTRKDWQQYLDSVPHTIGTW